MHAINSYFPNELHIITENEDHLMTKFITTTTKPNMLLENMFCSSLVGALVNLL